MTSKYVDSQDEPEPMLPVPFSQGQRSGIVVVVATVVVTASTVTSVDELALEHSTENGPQIDHLQKTCLLKAILSLCVIGKSYTDILDTVTHGASKSVIRYILLPCF